MSRAKNPSTKPAEPPTAEPLPHQVAQEQADANEKNPEVSAAETVATDNAKKDEIITELKYQAASDTEKLFQFNQTRQELLGIAAAAMPAIIAAYPNYTGSQVASAAFGYSVEMLAEATRRMQTYDESTGKLKPQEA